MTHKVKPQQHEQKQLWIASRVNLILAVPIVSYSAAYYRKTLKGSQSLVLYMSESKAATITYYGFQALFSLTLVHLNKLRVGIHSSIALSGVLTFLTRWFFLLLHCKTKILRLSESTLPLRLFVGVWN